MRATDRIKRSIAQSKGEVFVRYDFLRFGSHAQISRSLKALEASGLVVKIGTGAWAKAKPSAISGKPIPVRPVDALAPEVLAKLGIKAQPSKRTQAYNAGATTQIPAGSVINTGSKRISRKIGFGKQQVRYENTRSRTA